IDIPVQNIVVHGSQKAGVATAGTSGKIFRGAKHNGPGRLDSAARAEKADKFLQAGGVRQAREQILIELVNEIRPKLKTVLNPEDDIVSGKSFVQEVGPG